MQWEEGRNLVSANNGTTGISYLYDHNGQRTSKAVGDTIHTYYYASGKLLRETYGSTTLDFYYDASGTPFALKYGGTVYYYITNLQGDVIRIVSQNGASVADYEYSPFGEVISATGTLAAINPLRYRGYYYDTESELYYLNSRYYDPKVGRFINADAFVSTGQGYTGNNMFAYCGNDPVNRVDSDGRAFETVLDVVSLGVSIAEVAVNPYDPWAWAGLSGDLVDVMLPFVGGVGETVRALKTVSKVAEGTDEAIDTYRNLRKLTKGSDLEVHHIIEKRFINRAKISIENANDMFSIALSKSEHQAYTKAWREALPYGSNYRKEQVLQAAFKIYANNPKLLGAAIVTIVN